MSKLESSSFASIGHISPKADFIAEYVFSINGNVWLQNGQVKLRDINITPFIVSQYLTWQRLYFNYTAAEEKRQ